MRIAAMTRQPVPTMRPAGLRGREARIRAQIPHSQAHPPCCAPSPLPLRRPPSNRASPSNRSQTGRPMPRVCAAIKLTGISIRKSRRIIHRLFEYPSAARRSFRPQTAPQKASRVIGRTSQAPMPDRQNDMQHTRFALLVLADLFQQAVHLPRAASGRSPGARAAFADPVAVRVSQHPAAPPPPAISAVPTATASPWFMR